MYFISVCVPAKVATAYLPCTVEWRWRLLLDTLTKCFNIFNYFFTLELDSIYDVC